MAVQSGTVRYTCVITTVDSKATTVTGAPAPMIEGVIKSGKTIQPTLANIPAAFRWPVVGETWMVIQYNGSWYLDGMFPLQTTAKNTFTNYDQGDMVINSETGKVAVVGTIPDSNSQDGDFELFYDKSSQALAYSHDGTEAIVSSSGFYPGDLVYSMATTRRGAKAADGSAYTLSLHPELAALAAACPAWVSGGVLTMPDIQGRTVVGSGTGAGLTARALKDSFGEETHLLTTSEAAQKATSVTITDPGHVHTQTFNNSGASGGTGGPGSNSAAPDWAASNTQSSTTGITASVAGSSAVSAHNNLQPSIVLNPFIVY